MHKVNKMVAGQPNPTQPVYKNDQFHHDPVSTRLAPPFRLLYHLQTLVSSSLSNKYKQEEFGNGLRHV